ncbi:hypothetical protein Areg01_63530 [Actinoplanes regularis]|nr:hypothetical protein Areg01_63530 [Actinoplanes regularis]
MVPAAGGSAAGGPGGRQAGGRLARGRGGRLQVGGHLARTGERPSCPRSRAVKLLSDPEVTVCIGGAGVSADDFGPVAQFLPR